MKNLLLTLGILGSGILTGCASIVSGHEQPVSITTEPVKRATCSLENNKDKWYIPSTPGSVVINRSYQNLNIECQKKGYAKANKTVSSSTKTMAFGNILFGGIIGTGVDVATGAAYDYPQEIQLPIEKA